MRQNQSRRIDAATDKTARAGRFHQTPRDAPFPGPVIQPRVKKKAVWIFLCAFSRRRHGSPRSPGAQGAHFLRHHHRQRPGRGQLGKIFPRVGCAVRIYCGVHRRNQCLLQFSTGKSGARPCQCRNIKLRRIKLAMFQMNADNRLTRTRVGQIKKKISSKRPLRKSSGGSCVTSFDVATR